ncbi:hypothetical protein [Microcoleus sp. CAWBG58]|uniref:hypothetical protein n=1 Tax=Microcoleus sp. CAWBG58 TaxID=2841651 RepID=UPI0025F76CE1|nr:hypothetical protein [Microcoleus sp. CAWBG58]
MLYLLFLLLRFDIVVDLTVMMDARCHLKASKASTDINDCDLDWRSSNWQSAAPNK